MAIVPSHPFAPAQRAARASLVQREHRIAAVVDEARRDEARECDFTRSADGRAPGERGQVPESEDRRGERVGRKRHWHGTNLECAGRQG